MKAADILMWNNEGLGYGYLYNWYAASDANFGITDWRVPTSDEVQALGTELGGLSIAGGKLKETGFKHWNSPNTGATNSSGFSAFGAGLRNPISGLFSNIKNQASFWTSTIPFGYSSALYYQMNYDSVELTASITTSLSMIQGNSVKLIYAGIGTPPSVITDYDGNTYDVVRIGSQYWTVQNWKCTHYNDGISMVRLTDSPTDNAIWLTGWGSVEENYGFLYNHYAVSDANFGMTDWGIPSESEFSTFYSYLGSTYGSNSGGALKSTDSAYWNSPNTGATNSEGFFGIGSGYRRSGDDDFAYRKQVGFWWLSNQKVVGYYYNSSSLEIPLEVNADSGNAVRLIYKGTGTPSSTVTDIDGNVYNTVLIGTQYWLVQDFRCTKLKDGTDIPNVRPHSEWDSMTTRSYCIYDNQTRGCFSSYNNDENNV